jgi:hypothetical protein
MSPLEKRVRAKQHVERFQNLELKEIRFRKANRISFDSKFSQIEFPHSISYNISYFYVLDILFSGFDFLTQSNLAFDKL